MISLLRRFKSWLPHKDGAKDNKMDIPADWWPRELRDFAENGPSTQDTVTVAEISKPFDVDLPLFFGPLLKVRNSKRWLVTPGHSMSIKMVLLKWRSNPRGLLNHFYRPPYPRNQDLDF